MQKNVASQKWIVFAFDETDNTPKTGDAGNITAEISADGAAGGGNITDANPTELEDGYYVFDITQGECNADLLLILPESSTANIQVIGCPAAVYTTEPNRNKFSVDSNGRIDVIKVAGTSQTANDNGADLALIKAITDILFGFETTISAVQTADTVFDMTDGIPNIDDYNNMVVAIKDVSSGYWVARKVTDYDKTNLRITIDRDTGFPLAINDLIKFSNLSYTPTVVAGGGATAQEVHEYDVSGIATPGQAGYEIQQRGTHLSR